MTEIEIHNITRNIRENKVTNSATYVEIYEYTLDLKFPQSKLVIAWNCPFAGNDTGGSRSLLKLTYDNETVTRSGKYNSDAWELIPIAISGYVDKATQGKHEVAIEAMVDKGTLYIPHVNSGQIEGKEGFDVVLTVIEIKIE